MAMLILRGEQDIFGTPVKQGTMFSKMIELLQALRACPRLSVDPSQCSDTILAGRVKESEGRGSYGGRGPRGKTHVFTARTHREHGNSKAII